MGKIIGIDLGTTNSVVAVMEGNEPKVITNEEGMRTTPSVVAFEQNGNVLVGQHARRQAITNPENTVFSAKRFIGRQYSESNTDIERSTVKIVRANNGDAHMEIRGKTYPPPEISARVLMKLKKAAEDYLREPVTEAVITVPAYFNDAQRQATKDAGTIAGLEVKRIVNEPTAAALAYGRDKGTEIEKAVAVYDLGGGTYDISILEVAENVVEVMSTNGNTHLGGDDFDDRIIKWLIDEFKRDQGINIGADKLVLQRLKDAAEKAKIDLSLQPETDINLPFLTADATGPKHLQIRLSRAKFEALVGDLVTATLEPMRQALADAKKEKGEIDEILLVGGSTRIPLVHKTVEEFFGKSPNKSVNPDEVVALGAAIQGGVLSGDVKDIVLVDVTPLSLGIETLGGVMTTLISRNTSIPHRKSEIFTTAAENQSVVEVHVLQGERSMSADNRTLGKFQLVGIPPAPRGVPQIEVTFDIDANGIVSVSAKDKAFGKEQKITISGSSGLTEREIETMIKDAETFQVEDQKRRETSENKNKLEAAVIGTEKLLSENEDRIPTSAKKPVEAAIQKARDAIAADDGDAIATAANALNQATHAMTQAMYAGVFEPTVTKVEEEDVPRPAAHASDVVIDAEFEEKN